MRTTRYSRQDHTDRINAFVLTEDEKFFSHLRSLANRMTNSFGGNVNDVVNYLASVSSQKEFFEVWEGNHTLLSVSLAVGPANGLIEILGALDNAATGLPEICDDAFARYPHLKRLRISLPDGEKERLVLDSGFQKVGRLKEDVLHGDRLVDTVIYELDRVPMTLPTHSEPDPDEFEDFDEFEVEEEDEEPVVQTPKRRSLSHREVLGPRVKLSQEAKRLKASLDIEDEDEEEVAPAPVRKGKKRTPRPFEPTGPRYDPLRQGEPDGRVKIEVKTYKE